MTQTSYYWDGTTTGDATLAPYTEFTYHTLWRKMFLPDRTLQGVLQSYEDELQVVGVSGGVSVGKGIALVDGFYYENDARITVPIPTPASSTRIDLIVLRKDILAQTVRVVYLDGVEGGSEPGITQVDMGTWDIKLAQVTITTAGIVSVVDQRNFIRPKIFTDIRKWEVVDEHITTYNEDSFDFQNISQAYTHLRVTALGSYMGGSGEFGGGITMTLNNDATGTQYHLIDMYNSGASIAVGNSTTTTPVPWSFPRSDTPANYGAGEVFIPFYSVSGFAKPFYSRDYDKLANIALSTTYLYKGTGPITRIDVDSHPTYNFKKGCIFRILGLR